MPRIILHVDFNSFFASVEQQANPFLRGKAIAVAGKGAEATSFARAAHTSVAVDIASLPFRRSVVTTASREAKARGVKTAMATWEALRVCPDLIILPADPRKYAEITARFLTILARHSDAVEQFSADEAFCDVSLASGGDYFGATFVAERIRADIRRECGGACTVSIGVASNKLLAKLAGESHKPDGLTVVLPRDTADFVLTQKLTDVCGIGPAIAAKLGDMDISTLRALRNTPRSVLVRAFKSYGVFLFNAARGIGDDVVVEHGENAKSIGHSYTFPANLTTEKEVHAQLLGLADRVAWRMRQSGVVGRRVSAYVRHGDGADDGACRLLDAPLNDGLAVAHEAENMLAPLLDFYRGVRLLGVSVSELTSGIVTQSLFRKPEKMHSVLNALDTVQKRFGAGSWERASSLGFVFRERASGWHYDHKE